MIDKNINERIAQFKSLIDITISKHKPLRKNSEGSVEGLTSYLTKYESKLSNCIKELTGKGNEILKEFKEEKEEDSRVLKNALLNEIHKVPGKFKKKYWK